MQAERHAVGLLRDLAPQVVGVLARRYEDFHAVEDAVQEALVAATEHWTADEVPTNPRGWLIQTAERRLIDGFRRQGARRQRQQRAARGEVTDAAPIQHDDTLTLLLLCCHPSLTRASAIALTLRAVGGLTTEEVAAAFMVSKSTMGRRISRAKRSVREAGATFELPDPSERDARLRAVLRVLYVMFSEGYTATAGSQLHRIDLSDEAIRLTRMLRALVPDNCEVVGLLALMLLTDARRPARTGSVGELIPLAEQDRGLWDQDKIHEGLALTVEAMAHGLVGEYQLQASIAALHSTAADTTTTDWQQILDLYGLLDELTGNPMIALNRAVARAMVDGPRAALAELGQLEESLQGHHRLDAVRGHLYEMLGDHDSAVEHFVAAARRATNVPEQRYLITKSASLTVGQGAEADEDGSVDG